MESRFSACNIASTATPVVPKLDHFCVARIQVTDARVNTDFRVYRPGESIPSAEPTAWTTTGNADPVAFQISGIRLGVGANATYAVDELRVGGTWASVTTLTSLDPAE